MVCVNMAHEETLEISENRLDTLFAEMPRELVESAFPSVKEYVTIVRNLDQSGRYWFVCEFRLFANVSGTPTTAVSSRDSTPSSQWNDHDIITRFRISRY